MKEHGGGLRAVTPSGVYTILDNFHVMLYSRLFYVHFKNLVNTDF